MARASKYPDKRDDVLAAIGDAAARHGKPPTVRDLAAKMDVGVATMHSYLQKMAEEGVIEWRPQKHRSLRITDQGEQSLKASLKP